MADQEKHADKLSPRDEAVLHLIKEGHNYREIGQILDIAPSTAHRWGSEARRHFAEIQHIPLEILDFDKRHPGRGPRISDEEKALLNAYFEAASKDFPPLQPNFRSKVLAQLPGGIPPCDSDSNRRQQVQKIERERQVLDKRQR